jgi:pimeloyl-ACP methyl ester carboxylesterase
MAAVVRHRLADGTLAVLEAGGGGRPLLLCHGFTGAKEDFADWVDPFAAAGWWVVAPDLRGHGDSHQPANEAAYSLAAFAQELVELTEVLGWGQFTLLGHSMGGMIAQELVLGSPARVERLVLMNTHHGAVEGIDEATVALAIDVIRTQGLPALLALMAQLPAAPKTPAEVRVRVERAGYAEFADAKVHRCSAAMYAAMGAELTGRPDRLADLTSLALPVLVLVGEEDAGFLAASHRLAATVPGAQLVVIPDAAHSPQFENPHGWWAAVSAFLTAGPGEGGRAVAGSAARFEPRR